ncbi:hypothetical protein V7085_26895, partial [Priestia megaterium]
MLLDIPNLGVNMDEAGNLSSEYLPLLKLESYIAKQLKELKQIKMDLELSKSMFINMYRLADEEMNYILKHSLWFTACVTYNRCFSSGNGRGITLNERKYINHLDQRLIDAHKEVKSQRNQYIAHADINNYERAEVFGVLDFDSSTILGHSNFFTRTIVVNKEKSDLYVELVTRVMKRVIEEEKEKSDLLLKELETIKLDESN